MSALHLRLDHFARRAGVAGAIGAMLIAVVTGYYWSVVRPLQLEAEHLAIAQTASKGIQNAGDAQARQVASREERIRAFHGFFPRRNEVPGWIAKIYAAADAEKLTLAHGEYRRAAIKDEAPSQLRITLPLKGSYAQIRRFLTRALAEVPILALDEVSFQRQAAGDVQIEALVRFTLFVRED